MSEPTDPATSAPDPAAPDPAALDPAALDDAIASAAQRVVTLLAAGHRSLATAESLTGGSLGAAVTAVPGASQAYRGGVVAYATDLKHRLLGVDAGLLERRGAVDQGVARAMAQGVRQRLGADVGLATTGVAGPASQGGHRPGTGFVGVATAAGAFGVDVSVARPVPGREAVRRLTVLRALLLLLDTLERDVPVLDPAHDAADPRGAGPGASPR